MSFKDNEQHICNGKFKLLHYDGDCKLHWHTFYNLCLRHVTITALGQSLNVEVGNRGRGQNKEKKKRGKKRKQGGFRIQKIVQDGYKYI